MKIITLASEKGGPGKSTVATSLAVAAIATGEKVVLIELDKQATTANWAEQRKALHVDEPLTLSAHSSELTSGLDKLREADYTVVVIDTPGQDSVDVRPALALSSIIVVPTRPTAADLNGAMTTINVAAKLTPPILIVLTQTGAAKGDSKVREALEALEEVGPIYDRIVSRHTYQDALGAGYGVTELEPKGKAAAEIRELWKVIDGMIEEGK
jgi:chromosome partitioning protein